MPKEGFEPPDQTSIAIIGLAARFPGGVAGPADLWELLVSGRDPIGPIPAGRWSGEAYYSPDRNQPGRAVSGQGGFLEGVELFDPEPFGLSPAESAHLDPQQRLLLLGAAEALDAAGLKPAEMAGAPVGVFIGAFTCDYLRLQLADPRAIGGYASVGSMGTMLSNRLSHSLDLRGPSLTVDTACSSSLTALHLACQSLRRRECSLALAGGFNCC